MRMDLGVLSNKAYPSAIKSIRVVFINFDGWVVPQLFQVTWFGLVQGCHMLWQMCSQCGSQKLLNGEVLRLYAVNLCNLTMYSELMK